MHRFGPTRHLRRHQRTRGLTEATQAHAGDGIDVDGLIKRLAHALIFQRVLALDAAARKLVAELVHAKENGAVLDPVHHLQIAVLADAGQILRAGVKHEIHLARQQRGHARGHGLHGCVDDLGHIAFSGAPPVGVLHQHDLLVGLPFLQHEGSGAVRIAVGKVLVLRLDVFGRGRVVLLGPSFAHHAQLGHLVDEHRVGTTGDDVDGVVVHLRHLRDALGVDREVRGLGHGALDGEHRIVGREGRPIMKLHPIAQRDAQLRGRHLRPAAGQHGLGLEGAAVVVNKRLINRCVNAVGQGVVLRMDVPGGNVAGAGPFEGLCLDTTDAHRHRGAKECKSKFHLLTPK